MSGDHVAFYKGLRLGDVVRSVGAPEVVLADSAFEDSLHGNTAAAIERGPSARFRIEIEPILLRSFGGTEGARDFFLRRLDFASDLAAYAGDHASEPGSRFGTLLYCDQSLGACTGSAVSGTPNAPLGSISAGSDAISFATAPSRTVAAGEFILLVGVDGATELVEVATQSGADFTTDPVVGNFSAGVVGFVLSWRMNDAALVGSFRVGEGDQSPNAAKGAVLTFESAEDFEHAP